MSDLGEKVKMSIERLKAFEPEEGYYLAFSGGKDSVVCKALMDMAGVKYDAHYNVTSVDPPELFRFIKEKHPDVKREIPLDKDGKPVTMWNLIPKKYMPPTRRVRYCCQELKEHGGNGRMTVTGVRWAESVNRANNQGVVTVTDKNAPKEMKQNLDFMSTNRGGVVLTNDNTESRRMIEQCYRLHKTTVNPIIDWTDNDVWTFIRSNGIPYCELYDEGFERLGCIGCPMARRRGRLIEFARWPKYKANYLKAFDKMIKERKIRGKEKNWQTAEQVMLWWLEDKNCEGQINLFDTDGTDENRPWYLSV